MIAAASHPDRSCSRARACRRRGAGVRAAVRRRVRSRPTTRTRCCEYAELQQQFAQLVTTYQQIRTQYLLLKQQSQLAARGHERCAIGVCRRRGSRSRRRAPTARPAAGSLTANNGHEAPRGVHARDAAAAVDYGGAMGGCPADEAARVQTRYDRVQLADASITHGLEALGFLRGHQMSVETTIRNLEDDTYANDPDLNTQIAVLNKINATAVTVGAPGQRHATTCSCLAARAAAARGDATAAKPRSRASTRTSPS